MKSEYFDDIRLPEQETYEVPHVQITVDNKDNRPMEEL